MRQVKSRAMLVLLQMLVLLGLIAAAAFYYRETWLPLYLTQESAWLGLLLNGSILALFAVGLLRILMLFFSFAAEQRVLNRFIERAQSNVANPTYKLSTRSLVVGRYEAVRWLRQQNAKVDQAALASATFSAQNSRFTLVRFVHNSLILVGVLGTIVSLSVALISAAGLMESPENLGQMGGIISGMSTALSTTLTAIVCYLFYAYFHLCLQDSRALLLASLEEATHLYILPRFQDVEVNLLHDIGRLTTELKMAAESFNKVQDRFLLAGDRLQIAVDDLQAGVGDSRDDLRIIRDSLREGFRLGDSPKAAAVVSADSSSRDTAAPRPMMSLPDEEKPAPAGSMS